MTSQIKKNYGAGVNISFGQNPALIGGLRIQVGSDLYDGSVRTRLDKLERKFFKRTNFMSNLLQEIEAQIAGAKLATAKQNVGIVREIGDGVAKIEGLTDAMLNEMLDFGHGITGLALNLEETEVGAIILGDYTEIKEGDEVRTTGKLLQVPVGKGLLGRVVNALGQPLDGKGADQGDDVLSGRKNRAGHHQTPIRQPAGADRHHGH